MRRGRKNNGRRGRQAPTETVWRGVRLQDFAESATATATAMGWSTAAWYMLHVYSIKQKLTFGGYAIRRPDPIFRGV